MTKQHEVELDYIGMNPRPRYTCNTCGTTCLRQPYMSEFIWEETVDLWFKQHSPSVMQESGWRGG